MRIEYRIQSEEVEIVRCYGIDTKVVFPRKLRGFPVKKVAAYAFSARKSEEEKDVYRSELSQDLKEENPVEEAECKGFSEEEQLLAGSKVECVVFPDTIEEIGNYIFYGCKELKRLEFSDTLKSIGSGAFTGCGKLEQLRVHLKQGEKTCVKEILGDLWQRIDVEFFIEYKEDGNGRSELSLRENEIGQAGGFASKKKTGIEKVKLVFPEYYEEAVENTPARILFTQHHGIGNNYRQCFYSRKMDYQKYDELFGLAAAQDKMEVLTDLVFNRLTCPYQLSAVHEKQYEDFLREHEAEAAVCLIEQENMERLEELSRRALWSESGLDQAIRAASESGKEEALSFLMNERHRLYPKRTKKKFVL